MNAELSNTNQSPDEQKRNRADLYSSSSSASSPSTSSPFFSFAIIPFNLAISLLSEFFAAEFVISFTRDAYLHKIM